MPAGGIITAAAVGQTLLGGAKAIEGFTDVKRAKSEMANLRQPFYKIQQEYQQNRDIAAQEAQTGMPSAQRDYITQETQRGLGAGLGATLQGGGDVNNIAKILQGYNQSIGAVGAQDAQMHLENINRFMERSKELAGQKTMQWTLNEYQPYERKLNELKQRMAAGKQNEFGGLSDAISGVSALGTGMQNTALNKATISSLQTPTSTTNTTGDVFTGYGGTKQLNTLLSGSGYTPTLPQ